MATLILIRHGQSLWNAANRFTGWVDVPLSERGRAEAMVAACKLEDFLQTSAVQVCFTSKLIRSIETAIICLTEGDRLRGGRVPILKHAADDPDWHGWDQYEGDPDAELPIYPSVALDERYYGQLQGLDKAKTAARFGADQVQTWRRSFSVRPPGGESLEDTMQRTVPFFRDRILTHLKQGDNVLVAAHGNSLRSMVMYLDDLQPEEVPQLALKTGVPLVYTLDQGGQVTAKESLAD